MERRKLSRIINCNNPQKGSNPRIANVSTKLLEMIKVLPKHDNGKVFGNAKVIVKQRCFQLQREKLARKLKNPRLARITFHTIRHWTGTTEYHKDHNIVRVQEQLGHKSINSTMIYITLEKHMFKTSNDEFKVRIAKEPEEIQALMEVGF